jgi:glycosyltransferase involved in cell wall biosynthesis
MGDSKDGRGDGADLAGIDARFPKDGLPRVSVLMPVRNGARWLSEAVESVLAQTLSELELLAVDDGSTDETPEILARYAAGDSRVRLLRPGSGGLVAALNSGLAAARAPIIARLDSDDVALPHRLERQVFYLERHGEIGLLGSWAYRIDEAGRLAGRLAPVVDSDDLRQVLIRSNPFIHSSVVFRAALARDLGGYRAAFEAAEDYDLWLRISEAAEVANLSEPLIEYRVHAANVTNRKVIRQQFSVRLARGASRLRRELGKDPAAALREPPDWRAPESEASFYAEDARIYRFLELADPTIAAEADLRAIEPAVFAAQIGELTHGERRLGQLAVLNLLRRTDRGRHLSSAALVSLLVRLHPARACQLAWARLTGADRSRPVMTIDA